MNLQDKFTVRLGDYKHLTRPRVEAEATEAEIAQVLSQQLRQHATVAAVDAPAQLGDTVVIDYAGFLGEEQFEGGTAQGYPLKLGSHSFIPGFEEQLVGASAGDDVDVNVTFPEQYHAANLAGKPVVFKCKVHAVQQERVPELTDEFAQQNYGMKDAAALKDAIRASIIENKKQSAAASVQEAVVSQIIANSEVTITDAFMDECAEQLLAFFRQNLEQQGATLEMYCQYTGVTPETLKEQLRPQAKDRAEAAAVLCAVAEAEGLVVSDIDVEAELKAMADSYEITVEELKSRLSEDDIESLALNMRVSWAMKLVVESAKEA